MIPLHVFKIQLRLLPLVTILCFCGTFSIHAQEIDDTARYSSEKSKEIIARDMSFDMDTGEIKYTIDEPALVRIRISVVNGGPTLINLVDWEQRDMGSHTEVWDNLNQSKEIVFQRKNLKVNISFLPLDEEKRKNYSGNIRGFHKSPQLYVKFLEPIKESEKGIPIVSGKTPVRITIDPKDKEWLVESKFEMGLYIDHTFLAEDEEGANPYTYILDTTFIPNGQHFVIVNVVGYDGEVGVKAISFIVDNIKK